MSSEFPDAKAAASAPTVVIPAVPARRCENCGEPLLGDHCYSCGQPTKGLVRHFSSIIGDFMDSVIGLDSRIVRTLGPLYFRPGWLSTEYFAGRRVRFVSPVRLFVFLSIVAFFAARMSFDIAPDQAPTVVAGQQVGPGEDDAPGIVAIGSGDDPAMADAAADADADADATPADATADASVDTDPPHGRLSGATTVEQVEAIRAQALAAIAEGREDAKDVPGVGIGLDIAEDQVNREADERLAAIRRSQETGEPLAVEEDDGSGDDDGTINIDGEPWDAETNPLEIDWLPEAGNRKLNEAIGRAQQNLRHIKDDPNRLKDAILSTVPTTLFFLLPLFALFLKIAYLFKRRLYMEHLIVALHSHSFLCLSLLLALGLDAAATWTAGTAWLSVPLGWLETAVMVWAPVYLLLMQKRVYRQGWIMTTLKFCMLGFGYVMLISFSLVPLFMFSLVTM